MKPIIKSLSAILFNVIMSVLIASVVGFDPLYAAAFGAVVPTAIGSFMPKGAAMEGVYTEVWTGELVKELKGGMDGSFLNGIRDFSALVGNEAIHLVQVGASPEVLVNNTTYPIAAQELKDGDIVLGLDKYQTKKTAVTDDELYAISYDKMGSVIERHGEAITFAKFGKAAHALAPYSNTDKTPVIATTGEKDANNRQKLTRKDVIELKRRFDKNHIPVSGRRLVLCPDHVNDLLEDDQKFRDQYYNYTTGKIANMYGFEIYEFDNCPVYSNEGVKQDYATAEEEESNKHQASFAFYVPRAWMANGTTRMYYRDAATNPDYQQSEVNFRHYYIVMPLTGDCIGAIYSWDGTTPQKSDQSETKRKFWKDVRKEKMNEMSMLSETGEHQAAAGTSEEELE